jgi:hypothetical protein
VFRYLRKVFERPKKRGPVQDVHDCAQTISTWQGVEGARAPVLNCGSGRLVQDVQVRAQTILTWQGVESGRQPRLGKPRSECSGLCANYFHVAKKVKSGAAGSCTAAAAASFRMFKFVRKLFPRGEDARAAGKLLALREPRSRKTADSFVTFSFVRILFSRGRKEGPVQNACDIRHSCMLRKRVSFP